MKNHVGGSCTYVSLLPAESGSLKTRPTNSNWKTGMIKHTKRKKTAETAESQRLRNRKRRKKAHGYCSRSRVRHTQPKMEKRKKTSTFICIFLNGQQRECRPARHTPARLYRSSRLELSKILFFPIFSFRFCQSHLCVSALYGEKR